MPQTVEQHQFQAETKELLDLMIHAIYSNKDIFLRELISNGSDAIDKLRLESLTHPELKALFDQAEPHILIAHDDDKRTLTITDNGIGMTREDMVNLLGTIAKSGTREFLTQLKSASDQSAQAELIGQFGVGFYSSFMVADKVTVLSRKAGTDEITRWESTGDGTYAVESLTPSDIDNDFTHGTRITLQLKPADNEDGMQDYTQEWVIRSIVKKYSDFVAYPIQMDVTRTEVERDEKGEAIESTEKEVTTRETLNSMKAIWTRPQSEVTEDEYKEFYKHIAHDWTDPLKTIWMNMEGTFEAKALLFIPTKAPFDLYSMEQQRGVQLYIKRVFIMDDCKDLVPQYLRFLRGVVDSEDLSLNVSREILQQDRQVHAIRKRLEKKILSTLDDLKNNEPDTYKTFWKEFGKVLKEGMQGYDTKIQEQILPLCFFESSHSAEAQTTIDEYVGRMKPDQQSIYYVMAESRQRAEAMPHLESFREKGIEVLYFTDPIDELWTQFATQYQGKTFQNVGKGDVDLSTEDEKKAQEEARKEQTQTYGSLLEALKGKLDNDIKEVRLSNRLKSSASCLVSGDGDITPQLEQLMKAMNQEVPKTKRILEVNPEHPVMAKLQERFAANSDDALIGEYADLLYGQALLAEGGQLPDPARFTSVVSKLMTEHLNG